MIWQISILLISSCTLAGCAELAVLTVTAVAGGTAHAIGGEPGPDPPEFVHITDDHVMVWYDKKTFSAELHEEAEEMIREHCGGPFESERTELGGSFVVEARCGLGGGLDGN